MDKETFANFLSHCGKHDFEIACRIILTDAYNLNALNVDGANDGGTDFVTLDETGDRKKVAYQITTQKSDIKNKAYRDARKTIDKLGIKRYYFLCTYNLSETDCRALENIMSDELDIMASVYSPTLLSDIMISQRLVGKFLDRIGYDDLHRFEKSNVDYQEMALHSYATLSKDAKNLKSQIYDDCLLLVTADYEEGLEKEIIIQKAIDLLALPQSKEDFLLRRIDALSAKGLLKKLNQESICYIVSDDVRMDIRNRKIVYEKELSDLTSGQVDIFKEYSVDWNQEDSRQASVWIANTYMSRQLKDLEAADATLADNFYRNIDKNGYAKLRKCILNKGVSSDSLDEIIEKLLKHASTHPLLIKILHASVYLALEGGNPISSSKAIGASSWQYVNMLLEPTLGIPFICSALYRGNVNRYFDNAIAAVNRCQELGVSIYVPYYYIKECAGHLHMARKFNGLDLNPEEMQYSSNAYVSNYYALQLQGINIPNSFMDYLATFSPAIKSEKSDYKGWIREIMSDIQSLFTRKGIEFVDIPTYSSEELKDIETAYCYCLEEKEIQKPRHLMLNDILSIKYTSNKHRETGENWMILAYDKVLMSVAKYCKCDVWVSTPFVFLDLTEMSRDLSEMKLSTLTHSMASISTRTLSIGARILDRIILFASDKMQDWEFKEQIEKFKSEMVETISTDDCNFMDEIDKRTNTFLKNNGITMDVEEERNDVDIEAGQKD